MVPFGQQLLREWIIPSDFLLAQSLEEHLESYSNWRQNSQGVKEARCHSHNISLGRLQGDHVSCYFLEVEDEDILHWIPRHTKYLVDFFRSLRCTASKGRLRIGEIFVLGLGGSRCRV